MRKRNWTTSLVTRLVVSFCLGGVLLSVGLTMLEYRHAAHTASAGASQQMMVTARNLKEITLPLIQTDHREALGDVLSIFAQDPRITGIRCDIPGKAGVTAGHWPDDLSNATIWTFDESGLGSVGSLSLDRPTLLIAPFTIHDHKASLQLVIDGRYLRHEIRKTAIQSAATAWLFLAVLTLVGLLMLRRWFTGPLLGVTGLIGRDATAGEFEQVADETGGELGELAGAIARMLHRIDDITHELREREHAFENLYQFAPGALLSIGADGTITDANQRAVALFGVKQDQAIIGKAILDYIHAKDRGMFRQAIDRLPLDHTTHCSLKMTIRDRVHDIDVQLAGLFDDDQVLTCVRLSLVDVSESKRLLREVSEHRHLLNLVIDHMSDAILLVGPNQRILAANSRLCRLLNVHPDSLQDQSFDPVELWSSLQMNDATLFEKRMSLAMERPTMPCQEQFDSHSGSYRFQAIPVNDASSETIAQLWIVQDVTMEVRNRRMLEQQDTQLRALQQMGDQLHQARDLWGLIQQVTRQLHQIMGVEVVGVAIRHNDPNQRCCQLIDDGSGQSLIATYAPLARAVREHLMPKVLAERHTSYWPDLSQADDWATPIHQAGIDSLAASALLCQDRTQGIIWIARRGGERIERYHIYLLETLAPMISTAMQNAELREQMRQLALMDPVTGLLSFTQFPNTCRKISQQHQPWAALMIDMDRFKVLNDTYGVLEANRVLRDVADVLGDCCRSTDKLLHHSEDKFVVLCPHSDAHAAGLLAQRINQRIAAIALPHMQIARGDMTCSIGIAACSADADDPELLLNLATQRMRQAKAAGRNRITPPFHRPQQAG